MDNFHSGGMVVAVDLETGIVVTDATNRENQIFKRHPISGAVIKGFKIPYFKEAIDLIKTAIEENAVDGYLGWDIAITEKGPVIIEINSAPGVDVLQIPYTAEHIGMRHVLDKYL